MKIIIWLFSFVFFVLDIFCNDDLLSKFHQNLFKIKDVRIQLISYDADVFNTLQFKVFKYNRSTTAHNFTANFKVTVLEDKLEVLVQGYKFLSNEYRHFPIRYQVNIKKCVDANVIGLANIRNCGNFTTFYFYKDITYYACNFVADETRFPPLIPNGKFKFDLKVLYLDREVMYMHFYHEIYTPIKYPKN